MTSPWPHHDLTMTSPWPHHDLTMTSPWPHYDLTMTSPWPHHQHHRDCQMTSVYIFTEGLFLHSSCWWKSFWVKLFSASRSFSIGRFWQKESFVFKRHLVPSCFCLVGSGPCVGLCRPDFWTEGLTVPWSVRLDSDLVVITAGKQQLCRFLLL